MSGHTTSLAGIDIHYTDLGGTGAPLLLLHGITDSHESYLASVPRLRDAARVYALDFRGHGGSAHAPPYRLRDYAADVRHFVEQVAGGPPVLAGHSLGGLVASYLASQPGANLRGAFLEDPPLYRARMPAIKETAFYPFFVAVRDLLQRHHASGDSLDDLARVVGRAPADPARPDGPTFLEARGEEEVRRRARSLRSMDPAALDEPIRGSLFDDFDPDADLAKIECPVHLLAGSEPLGGAMTADDIERVAALIPRCTRAVWDDIGHTIHHDRPEAYADELISFLDRIGT